MPGHVTIGILGKTPSEPSHADSHHSECVCFLAALQGAFVEHEVVLQKLSVGKRVVVVQVRTTTDLDQCDALVIPGGGASDSSLDIAGCTHHNYEKR